MKINILSALLIVFTIACKNNKQPNLAVLEKQELATGVRHDSLFLGMYFGMPKEVFFEYCRGMNRQGLFNQGTGLLVEYNVEDKDLPYPLLLSFFPELSQDVISEMTMYFSYKNLVLWKEEMSMDRLSKDVKKLMQKWLGGHFFVTTLPGGKKVFAQVSGNRRVIIEVEETLDNTIKVTISDLSRQIVR